MIFMKPTQTLPDHFRLAWNLDIKHNTRLNVILQIAGLGWLLLSGWLLSLLIQFIRPEAITVGFKIDILTMLGIMVILVATILLHELVHGLFFWIFSHHKPEFGLGLGYAFAAMPDWFFPKWQYMFVGLSPLALITATGLLFCIFIPANWLPTLLFGMVINIGGAIGDIYVCWRIAIDEKDVCIRDTGDGFELYRRQVI